VSKAEGRDRANGPGRDKQFGRDGLLGGRDVPAGDAPAGREGPFGPDALFGRERRSAQEGRGVAREQDWLDADAGRLVRPYTVSGGRTKPTVALDLLSMVRATGRNLKVDLSPEHTLALDLSNAPVTVAEIGAHLKLPVAVAKILLSDLIDQGAVTARPPDPAADPADRDILQRVLDGLHKRLLQ
jgi:hypothetical protein